MNISDNNIRALTRAIYILTVAVFINITVQIYIFVSPSTTNSISLEAKPSWKPKSMRNDIPDGALGEQIRYGHRIITNTSKEIGPLAENKDLRFAGNNLNCNNCHLNAGRKIGSGSFIGVMNRFPQFNGRANAEITIEDRINGCMERSMNGVKMPNDSKEMQAMIAYMQWLSEGVPPEIEELYKGYMKVEIPVVKADTAIGKILYAKNCMRCHMPNGTGLKVNPDTVSEYIYPPIGGNDSYNNGAGMNRIITAAQFIKGNMPFGATYDSPELTDEEAFHLAAYINSLPRPEMIGLELDYPKQELKPISTPYGPWADSFNPEQHKYGPFLPIVSYYEEKYGKSVNK